MASQASPSAGSGPTSSAKLPQTLGALKQAGYRPRTVREEIRENLIARMEQGKPLLERVLGYEDTVVPHLENAILSGHDMILLGERGQGKTRIIRSLVELLDEWMPIVAGSEVHDSPFAPVSRHARDLLDAEGDAAPIAWVHRSDRYAEKLATPDTTAAELIGEIDPVKVAEGRYLSDELTIHYGLVPRCNRGIFAINELPDLAEKVQVSLFNVLEERDLQIKGYKIRMPLDILVVATANPEDYTSRGRIITPLKDRYSAHIRTHYPQERGVETAIMEQEFRRFDRGARRVVLPDFMKDIVAELTFQARKSADVSQVSGVSVRMSINNLESLVSNAERRAIRHGETEIVPRISDLVAMEATTDGKLELEYGGPEEGQQDLIGKLLEAAVLAVFSERLELEELEFLVASFKDGWWVEVSDQLPSAAYLETLGTLKGIKPGIERLGIGESPGEMASAIEFILEGLHLSNKLNKDTLDDKVVYNEAHKVQTMGRNPELA